MPNRPVLGLGPELEPVEALHPVVVGVLLVLLAAAALLLLLLPVAVAVAVMGNSEPVQTLKRKPR